MFSNDNVNSSISTGKKLDTKTENYMKLSGVCTARLPEVEGGQEVYEAQQHHELLLEAARRTWLEAYSAIQASRDGVDAAKKEISGYMKAAVSTSELQGVEGLRDFLVFDANDEVSGSRRLAQRVKDLPFVGEGFSQALAQKGDELIARLQAHQEIAARFDAATRDFGKAFYRASASLAQAKALLMANGIQVVDKKPAKKKAKVTAVPAPRPTPAPSPVDEDTDVPAPAPTPMPIAA